MSTTLKASLFCAVCALRAYDYYWVLSSPGCTALEIRDFSQAFRLDALFLLYLWLLLFRWGKVRDALDGRRLLPYFPKSAILAFSGFAIGGWVLSTYATHDACAIKNYKNYMRPTAEAKARAASVAAFIKKQQAAEAKARAASAAASAASAAALHPPGAPASAGQKAHTH